MNEGYRGGMYEFEYCRVYRSCNMVVINTQWIPVTERHSGFGEEIRR